jgi:hypothetical protein
MEEKVVLKHSKLCIASLVLAILGVINYLNGFVIAQYIPKDKEPYIMMLTLVFWVSGFVLGVIDLFKKRRRKVLSIVAIIINGLPLSVFVLIVLVIHLYTS